MKPFKFLAKNKHPFYELADHTIVLQRPRQPRNRQNIINQGWRAHRDNIPPGQCPYGIGSIKRRYWMIGWSDREQFELNTN